MPKRKAENDAWGEREITILALYETHSLDQVMKTMENQGFKRTKAQYEEFFRKRKMSKNVKAHEWKHIGYDIAARAAQNKDSTVVVRGKVQSATKVRKMTEKHKLSLFETLKFPDKQSPTPDDIVIFTPASSPHPQATISFNGANEAGSVSGGVTTPWHQFIDFVHGESFLSQFCLAFPPRQVDSSPIIDLLTVDAAPSMEVVVRNQQLLDFPTFHGPTIGSLFKYDDYVHPVHFNSRSYLPPHVDTTVKFDITGLNTYLEFMKHVVLVVSNNLDAELIEKLVVILAEDVYARNLFARLTDHNLISLRVCAERFWTPVVQYGNCALVQALIDTGVDLNIRGGSKAEVGSYEKSGRTSLPAITALQCAIENGHDTIIDLLLKYKANDWHAKILHSSTVDEYGVTINKFKVCTLIDLAIHMQDPELLRKLLDSELHILGYHQSASQYTLRLANKLDRPDLAMMVLNSRAGLIPLHATSSGPTSTPLYKAQSFQLSTIDHAPANDASKKAILLSLVMDIKRRGMGRAMKPRHRAAAQAHTAKDVKNLPSRLPALHVAILGHGIQFMALLLEHGADPNQCGGAYPIHLAVDLGSLEMVKILIAHDSKLDAVLTKNTFRLGRTHGIQINTRQPAICYAWRTGCFEIVGSLLKAGARFPKHDPADNYLNPVEQLFASAAPGKGKDGRIDSEDYFDPWVDAIRFNGIAELPLFIQCGEEYIGHGMTTSHLARCILIYGASNTTKFIMKHDLLGSDEMLDPLILSALVYAGEEGMARAMTAILIGKDPTQFVQRYGTRALLLAVAKGHIPFVQLFLESGVNPFAAQELGRPEIDLWRIDWWYALEYESRYKGRFDGIICGPNSSLPTELVLQVCSSTPFQTACMLKDKDAIKAFIAWKPAVDDFDFEYLRTNQLSAAYLSAICSGNIELERLIAENGIDVDSVKSTLGDCTVEEHYRAGLQRAMEYEETRLAKRLLSLGADGNTPDICVDYMWRTPPLIHAVWEIDTEDIVKILLDRGADPNEEGSRFDTTPLVGAAWRGSFENLQRLIEAGADINASKNGETVLQTAASSGRLDMASYLLQAGADVKGKENPNYLESVRAAWKNGHHTLARMIQDWKKERYGEDDCEPIESIVESIVKPQTHPRTTKPLPTDSDSDSDSDSDIEPNNDFDSETDDDLYVQTIYPLRRTHPL